MLVRDQDPSMDRGIFEEGTAHYNVPLDEFILHCFTTQSLQYTCAFATVRSSKICKVNSDDCSGGCVAWRCRRFQIMILDTCYSRQTRILPGYAGFDID